MKLRLCSLLPWLLQLAALVLRTQYLLQRPLLLVALVLTIGLARPPRLLAFALSSQAQPQRLLAFPLSPRAKPRAKPQRLLAILPSSLDVQRFSVQLQRCPSVPSSL